MQQVGMSPIRKVRGKRLLDVTAALMLLVISAPLMALLAVIIRITSAGPALFKQRRVGRGGRDFTLLKFRTMMDGCPDDLHRDYIHGLLNQEAEKLNGLYKLDHDPRVTTVGRVLRRFSLDELPQLINVLRGDMSLVGPRPVLPWEMEMLPESARMRLRVLPGLTGLWQVNGRNRLTLLDGLALDLEYVERQTLWLDLWILVKTPVAVLVGSAR